MPGGLLVAPFFFFGGWVSRARPASTAGAAFFVRSGPCPRWWLGAVVGGWWQKRTLERPGRRSRSAISKRSAWCARRTRWAGRGAKGAAGWGRAGTGWRENRNGPATEAAGPGGTLASGGAISLEFFGDGPRRPDRPDRCRRAAWWRVRERGLSRCLHGP